MKGSVHNDMAMWAFEKVAEAAGEKKAKEFRSLARSFPSILQVNGLGMAVAFLESKKAEPHTTMHKMITGWIEHNYPTDSSDALMKRIVTLDSASYRMYANEIMNLCLWIKRFAEGLIDGE